MVQSSVSLPSERGERIESVRGCDVFLIQSTNPPAENFMELCMMIDAAKRASANYITAVIEYALRSDHFERAA